MLELVRLPPFWQKRGLPELYQAMAVCYTCGRSLCDSFGKKKRKRISGGACEEVRGLLESIAGHSLSSSPDYLCHLCHQKLKNILTFEADARKLRQEISNGVSELHSDPVSEPPTKRVCTSDATKAYYPLSQGIYFSALPAESTNIQCTTEKSALPHKEPNMSDTSKSSPKVTVSLN